MEILLAPLLVVWMALPVAVVLAPPVVAASSRRWTAAWSVLYLAALGLVVAYGFAASADMDRADSTGGRGSILAGGAWLVAAVLCAAASCWSVHRRRRPVLPPR